MMNAAVDKHAMLDALLTRQTVWRAGRAPIAAPRGEPTGFDALDALLPQRGWPCAALTELLLPCDGVGELALLLPTLARLTQAGGIVVLVAPPYVPYAPAWRDAGVELSNLHIVDADARGALWAFEQALRSGACAAVLGWPQRVDAQALRRLQVAADSGDCLGFAFRDRKHAANPSPAALRIEYVRNDEGVGAWHVRKCRGGNAPQQAFAPATACAGAASVASFSTSSLDHPLSSFQWRPGTELPRNDESRSPRGLSPRDGNSGSGVGFLVLSRKELAAEAAPADVARLKPRGNRLACC